MMSVLPSDAGGRIRTLRHDLTLELFLRDGPFWELVSGFRERWDVEVTVSVPNLPRRSGPREIPARTNLADANADDYLADLLNIHDAVVPLELRGPMPDYSWLHWKFFLTAAALWDPPADRLIEYADACTAHGENHQIRFSNGLDREPVDITTRSMVAPPIVYFHNPDRAEEAEREYWQKLLRWVNDEHLKPLGLNLNDMLQDVWRRHHNELSEWRHASTRDNPSRHYIHVDKHTTDDDVKTALRLLRDLFPSENPRGRRRRDRLESVQCAIWHDDYGLKHREIAERMGWEFAPAPDSYGKPRTDRVRGHIQDGRELLVQINRAE